MNHGDIIESQIDLLVNLNQELARQATPEAAREIRENALAILKLTEIETAVKTQDVLEDLEERLEALEDAIFGDEDVGRLDKEATLVQFLQDCRDDLDSVYEYWYPALKGI